MFEVSSIVMANLVIPVAFFFLLRKVIAQVVDEKETGIKTYLEVNGLRNAAVYYSSFLFSESIIALIVSIFYFSPLL